MCKSMYGDVEQIIILISVVFFVVFILYLIFKSPFKYPYFKYYFDVSGKRNPDIENLIDNFLNQRKFLVIKKKEKEIERWC